jgi:hypothetical protein
VDAAQTKYAKTIDGVNIAYRVHGAGPLDLAYIMGGPGNIEAGWETPWCMGPPPSRTRLNCAVSPCHICGASTVTPLGTSQEEAAYHGHLHWGP